MEASLSSQRDSGKETDIGSLRYQGVAGVVRLLPRFAVRALGNYRHRLTAASESESL